VVQRAIESLRDLPPVRGEAVDRIVAAAARSRAQDTVPHDDDLLAVPYPARERWRATSRVVLGAAAAAIVLISAAIWQTHRTPRTVAIQPAAPAAATPASMSTAAIDAAPVPTQFIFDGNARHVSLVGDFNNWDERATPLTREPGTKLWSVTVPVVRGRHIYAFLVDSVWTVDKRAPVARDPDFGVTGSVILVGRP
jgi:cytochrome oxidase assembly protein ShyY1